MPEKYKTLWHNRILSENLKSPAENPFICSDFEIFEKNEDQKVKNFKFSGNFVSCQINFSCIQRRFSKITSHRPGTA